MPWKNCHFAIVPLILSLSLMANTEPLAHQENNSPVQGTCIDSDPKCALWASQGECHTNAIWMMSNCRRSCQSCQGGDRAWQLRSQLAKNYDNSTNSNGTRLVRIESVRIQHMEIDETREQARIFGRLVLSWNDSKVSWDRETWGLSWLNFYWVQVWTPQLLQINAPNPSPGQITGKVLAANYTGQVFMWTDFNFLAPFNFEYGDFPKDRQRICYQFDDKRYFAVKFVVSGEVKNRQHEAIADAHISGWDILRVDISDSKYAVQLLGDWRQNPFDIQSTNCEICVELQRNAVFWLAEMLVPAMVTTALTLSAVLFQLALSQAFLLAFSILGQLLNLQLINARLPSYMGTVPSILKFTVFNLLSTALLFLFTILLRRLSHANSNIPLPRSVYALMAMLDRLLPLPKGGKDLTEENSPLGNYAEISLTLNNVLFAIFAFLYIWTFAASFLF